MRYVVNLRNAVFKVVHVYAHAAGAINDTKVSQPGENAKFQVFQVRQLCVAWNLKLFPIQSNDADDDDEMLRLIILFQYSLIHGCCAHISLVPSLSLSLRVRFLIAFELNCLKIIERARSVSIEHTQVLYWKLLTPDYLTCTHTHKKMSNLKIWKQRNANLSHARTHAIGTCSMWYVIESFGRLDEAIYRRACASFA